MLSSGCEPSAALTESLRRLHDGLLAGIPVSDWIHFSDQMMVWIDDSDQAFVITSFNEIWVGAWITPLHPGRVVLHLLRLPAHIGRRPHPGENLKNLISDPEIAVPMGAVSINEVDWTKFFLVILHAHNGLSMDDYDTLYASYYGVNADISPRVWNRLIPWMLVEFREEKMGLVCLEDQILDA